MIEINHLYEMDCLIGMEQMMKQGLYADLIVTDPPYDLPDSGIRKHGVLSDSMRVQFEQMVDNDLLKGITTEYLDAMLAVQKNINVYIFCNTRQLPFYLDYFVTKHHCGCEVLIWHKTNAMPLYNHRYISDKEFLLYFRKGGLCDPKTYEAATSVYTSALNSRDKRKYGHPTVKPYALIEKVIRNSSREGDLVLDPFAGTGTTLVAAENLERNWLGFEYSKRWCNVAAMRLMEETLWRPGTEAVGRYAA